ncbi:MAG: hypothetical protein H0U71_03925 [Gammaproteobacteria bacterium]|nr:hypothetical protein [Gammaproteobacteria bacterium]
MNEKHQIAYNQFTSIIENLSNLSNPSELPSNSAEVTQQCVDILDNFRLSINNDGGDFAKVWSTIFSEIGSAEKPPPAALLNAIDDYFNDNPYSLKIYILLKNPQPSSEKSNFRTLWELAAKEYHAYNGESPLDFVFAISNFYRAARNYTEADRVKLSSFLNIFKLLLPDAEKKFASSQQQLLLFSDLYTQSLIGSLNHSKYELAKTVCNQFITSIASHLDNDRIPPEKAEYSETFHSLVREEISHVLAALETFYGIGFEPNNLLEELSAHNSPENNEYHLLQQILQQDQTFIDSVNGAAFEIAAEIPVLEYLEQLSSKTHKSSTALGELQKLARSINSGVPIERRSLEDQAAFKHQVSKIKYTISDEETIILAAITGITVTKLVQKYSIPFEKNVLTYDDFITLIDNEIAKRQKANKRFIAIFPPFREKIAHLEIVKNYVQHCSYKYDVTVNSETHLGQLKPGEHPKSPSSKVTRAFINKQIQKIPFYSRHKSKLNALKKILKQKIDYAATLKFKADLLRPTTMPLLQTIMHANLRPKKAPDPKNGCEPSGKILNPFSLQLHQNLFSVTMFRPELQAALEQHKFFNRSVLPNLKNKEKTLLAQYREKCPVTLTFTKEEDGTKLDNLFSLSNSIRTKIKNIDSSAPKTAEEIKACLKEINELIWCDQDLGELLKEELATLSLKEYIIITKQLFLTAYKQLIKDCNVPSDFNPDEPLALNKVSKMLLDAKNDNATLKSGCHNYLAALHMQILAKQEIVVLLSLHEFTSGSDSEKLEMIEEYLRELTNNLMCEKYIIAHPKYIQNAKIIELMVCLNDLKKSIEEGSIPKLASQYEAEIATLQQEHLLETGKVKTLINAAQKTVDAFSYFADHATHNLGRGPVA